MELMEARKDLSGGGDLAMKLKESGMNLSVAGT